MAASCCTLARQSKRGLPSRHLPAEPYPGWGAAVGGEGASPFTGESNSRRGALDRGGAAPCESTARRLCPFLLSAAALLPEYSCENCWEAHGHQGRD